MKIILGISSSISAYKTPDLVRGFKKKGVDVVCVLTKNAKKLVSIKSLETVSENRVICNIWKETDPLTHINILKDADAFVIAPASANIIGKIASGIADDGLSTISLAATCRKYIAPAMNSNMLESHQVQKNIDYLVNECEYKLIPSGVGELACLDYGSGRLADLDDIVSSVIDEMDTDLSGKTFVVSAGATIEWIDSIRYITNRSSGKMGYAIASEIISRGGKCIYKKEKTTAKIPTGVDLINVETTSDMLDMVKKNIVGADVLIMAAAPLDFRPAKSLINTKIKKTDIKNIELTQNDDIIKKVRENNDDIFIVAFAAEYDKVLENAKSKIIAKKANLIIANKISDGFETDDNKISIINSDLEVNNYDKMSKSGCAKIIVDRIKETL